MSGKDDFTQEEWSRVLASPMVSSAAITAADPSGLWGLLKEGMAGGWALVQAKKDPQANPLVKAIAEDFTTGAAARESARERVKATFGSGGVPELKSRAIQELRAVATLVESKAPQDAAGFKAWLGTVAQRAAEAAKEGGFLGFGGVAVSESEKATLTEINSALGLS